MIDISYTYAIVGASNNTEKYGYKVFKDLLDAKYNVIPINPKGGKLLLKKIYPTLSDYEGGIDVVIFVTPPSITEQVLEEVKKLEINKVWFQPGAESNIAIKFCEENNIEYTANTCIMIQKNI